MRSEPWLIFQTGTKTIPIYFQNHRFVIDPATPVITCFFSSTHYIFVNKLVWIIVPLVGKWQVVQITYLSYIPVSSIKKLNTIRSKISFIQIRLVQIDVVQAPNFHGMFMSVSSPMSKFMYINAFHVSVLVLKVHMLSYVHT
jgi:hypothetical protein